MKKPFFVLIALAVVAVAMVLVWGVFSYKSIDTGVPIVDTDSIFRTTPSGDVVKKENSNLLGQKARELKENKGEGGLEDHNLVPIIKLNKVVLYYPETGEGSCGQTIPRVISLPDPIISNNYEDFYLEVFEYLKEEPEKYFPDEKIESHVTGIDLETMEYDEETGFLSMGIPGLVLTGRCESGIAIDQVVMSMGMLPGVKKVILTESSDYGDFPPQAENKEDFE